MRRGLVLTAFILVGFVLAYSDAIASEGEVLMATFTIAGFVVILLMEHRQQVRFPVLMRTVFVCSNAMAGEGVVENVSMDGCKVRSTTTVESCAELRLQLYPSLEAPQIEVQRAVVNWAGDGQFGVRFSEMGHEHKTRLRRLVNTLS